MINLIAGSLILSLTHALIPNHWFPLAAISRSQKWTTTESIKITAITGFLHTLSTILFGIAVGFVGYKLGSSIEFISETAAPLILILFGLFLVFMQVKSKGKHIHKHIDEHKIDEATKKSKKAIVAALGTMMFFSPCIEIEAYYFTAGQYGWQGILTLSGFYLAITLAMMIVLVELARRGLDKLNKNLHFLEHYERLINGIILILLGLLQFVIGH
jgi:putative Mn2+ efflux pump MntP